MRASLSLRSQQAEKKKELWKKGKELKKKKKKKKKKKRFSQSLVEVIQIGRTTKGDLHKRHKLHKDGEWVDTEPITLTNEETQKYNITEESQETTTERTLNKIYEQQTNMLYNSYIMEDDYNFEELAPPLSNKEDDSFSENDLKKYKDYYKDYDSD